MSSAKDLMRRLLNIPTQRGRKEFIARCGDEISQEFGELLILYILSFIGKRDWDSAIEFLELLKDVASKLGSYFEIKAKIVEALFYAKLSLRDKLTGLLAELSLYSTTEVENKVLKILYNKLFSTSNVLIVRGWEKDIIQKWESFKALLEEDNKIKAKEMLDYIINKVKEREFREALAYFLFSQGEIFYHLSLFPKAKAYWQKALALLEGLDSKLKCFLELKLFMEEENKEDQEEIKVYLPVQWQYQYYLPEDRCRLRFFTGEKKIFRQAVFESYSEEEFREKLFTPLEKFLGLGQMVEGTSDKWEFVFPRNLLLFFLELKADLLTHLGNLTGSIKICKEAMEIVMYLGEEVTGEKILWRIKKNYEILGLNQEALELMDEFLKKALNLGLWRLVALTCELEAFFCDKLKLFASELTMLRKALEIRTAIGERRSRLRLLLKLALFHQKKGGYELTDSYFREALTLAESLDEEEVRLKIIDNYFDFLLNKGEKTSLYSLFNKWQEEQKKFSPFLSYLDEIKKIKKFLLWGETDLAIKLCLSALRKTKEIFSPIFRDLPLKYLGIIWLFKGKIKKLYSLKSAIPAEFDLDKAFEGKSLSSLDIKLLDTKEIWKELLEGVKARREGKLLRELFYFRRVYLQLQEEIEGRRDYPPTLKMLSKLLYGKMAYLLGELEEANRTLEEVEKWFRKNNWKYWLEETLFYLALVKIYQGKIKEAKEKLMKAYSLSRKMGFRWKKALLLLTESFIEWFRGNYKRVFRVTKVIMRLKEFTDLYLNATYLLAESARKLNKVDEIEISLKEALNTALEADDKVFAILFWLEQSKLFRMRKDFANSMRVLRSAFSEVFKSGFNFVLPWLYYEEASLNIEMGKITEALLLIEKGMENAVKFSHSLIDRNLLYLKEKVAFLQNNFSLASDIIKEIVEDMWKFDIFLGEFKWEEEEGFYEQTFLFYLNYGLNEQALQFLLCIKSYRRYKVISKSKEITSLACQLFITSFLLPSFFLLDKKRKKFLYTSKPHSFASVSLSYIKEKLKFGETMIEYLQIEEKLFIFLLKKEEKFCKLKLYYFTLPQRIPFLPENLTKNEKAKIKELLESKGLKEEDTENKYFWTGNSLSIW